jgi:hypothetical protein
MTLAAALLLGLGAAVQDPAAPLIPWMTDLPAALERAGRENKPVVACFVAAWCQVCRRFKAETLPSPELAEIGPRSIWVLLEIDRNISLARTYRIRATPTVDLIDPAGVTRTRLSGYLSPRDFRRQFDEFERDRTSTPSVPRDYSPREHRGDDMTGLTETPDGYRGTGICFSNVGYGPLRLQSLSPFQALRFSLQPRTPSTLAAGAFEVHLSESWANEWARNEGDHLVDFEVLQEDFSISYGVSDVLQIDLGFVERSRFGGRMDRFIQEFHDAFHIDQGGRDEVPKGDFGMLITENGATVAQLTNRDRGSYSESILLTAQHNVTCGTDGLPALAYALTVRAELGDQEDIHDGELIDVLASLSASKKLGDVFAYLGVGVAWFGKERFQDVELRTTQLSLLVAIEWQFAGGASVVVQYLLSEGVAQDLADFSEPSNEVTFGLKLEVAPMTVLELGLIENVVTSDNSPDFGLHAGLLWRF